jgi:predicted nucleic acid-binding protein
VLVIDASAAVDLCLSPSGFDELSGEDLVAPQLIRSESLSALHEMRWRGEIPDEMAELGLERRREMPVRIELPSELSEEAWRVAEEFGWAMP